MKLMDRRRRRRLAREAAEWTTALGRGDPKDEAPFNAWWSRSWRHMAAAMDMAAMENEISRALARSQERPLLPARGRVTPRGQVATLAAGLAAALIAGIGLYFAWPLFPRTLEYSTGTGEQHLVHLDDGTAIHINTQSRVRVRYSGAARSIELEGEALFDVGDDARPFSVHTGSAVIRDIGTRFNVRQRADDIDVAVLSGEVRVSVLEPSEPIPTMTSNTALHLEAGDTAHINTGRARPQTAPVRVTRLGRTEIEERVLWTTGMLAFTGQSLSDVVAEVNRYNPRQLEIADAATGEVKVGGHFRARDLDSFVRALGNLGIQVESEVIRADGSVTLVLRQHPSAEMK